MGCQMPEWHAVDTSTNAHLAWPVWSLFLCARRSVHALQTKCSHLLFLASNECRNIAGLPVSVKEVDNFWASSFPRGCHLSDGRNCRRHPCPAVCAVAWLSGSALSEYHQSSAQPLVPNLTGVPRVYEGTASVKISSERSGCLPGFRCDNNLSPLAGHKPQTVCRRLKTLTKTEFSHCPFSSDFF